jgi:hypothetical protein
MALKAWISEAIRETGEAPGAGLSINLRRTDYPLPGELEADKNLFSARDEIIAGGVFYFTPETQAAEAAVSRAYKAILNGGSDFDSLRAACARWVEAAQTRPAPPVVGELFPKVNKV